MPYLKQVDDECFECDRNQRLKYGLDYGFIGSHAIMVTHLKINCWNRDIHYDTSKPAIENDRFTNKICLTFCLNFLQKCL